jgi:hypothetical protein
MIRTYQLSFFLMSALTMLMVAPALGQVNWTNAAADNDLANPANWSPATGFTGGNNTWDVNLLGANRAELSSSLTMQRDLRIGDAGGQGELFINGGDLTVTRDMRHGRQGGATGFGLTTVEGTLSVGRTLFIGQGETNSEFNLHTGSVTVGDSLNVAHQSNNNGTLNIAGGTFTVQSGGAVFSDGGGGPSTSVLNISGNGSMNVVGANASFANNGGGATSTVSIADTGSLTANNVRIGFGDSSVATVNISGGSMNASTGFITMGQGADANVTVNMSGGAINADRLIFANNGVSTLNMTGGSINLANSGGGQSTAGALVLGSAGAALNIGGEAVVNAEKLFLNNGGLLTLSGNGLIDISGSTDGTNATFDFSSGLLDWSSVLGQINFASTGAFLRVAGEDENIGGPVNFVNLFNEAINENVFYTTVSGGVFDVGYNAGGNFSFVRVVPEPSSLAMVVLIGAGLLSRRSRRV